jgi:hypothetical protein
LLPEYQPVPEYAFRARELIPAVAALLALPAADAECGVYQTPDLLIPVFAGDVFACFGSGSGCQGGCRK